MHQPRDCQRTRPRFESYLDTAIDTGALLVLGKLLFFSARGVFAATELPLILGTNEYPGQKRRLLLSVLVIVCHA